MLKKMMALAATTAMLGANMAAFAISSARAAVRSVTGSPAAGGEDKEPRGTSIQPSIPPMPTEPVQKAAPPKAGAHKVAAHKPAANQRVRTNHKKSRAKPRTR